MEVLLGKTLSELEALVTSLNLPRYRAKQLSEWLYQKRATTFEEMSNLPKPLRQFLSEQYRVGRTLPLKSEVSTDGTEKYLFLPLDDSTQPYETAYIPDGERATLCVSSQVGCKMNCSFCATGKMGFLTNLTAGDILNQVLSVPYSERLTNIVFMGMGEPLDNYEEVAKAIEILTEPYGFGWSPKRITVSTIGPKKGLTRLLEEQKVHVAISIHSPISEERLSLMPVEKAFPITQIIETLERFDFSAQRRLSFEYILFDALNDSLYHADTLRKLIGHLDCRVNLIRYHAIPGIPLIAPTSERVQAFEDFLNKHGIRVTTRRSRGEDISAACGMLSTKEDTLRE